MEYTDIIEEGINKGLIELLDDGKNISYINHPRKRNYTNPEEKVQAETFLKLVLELGYPHEQIEHYVTVTMGSEKKEADLIVYDDPKKTKPIIVVECKKEEVSKQEFAQATRQAFSYASAISVR